MSGVVQQPSKEEIDLSSHQIANMGTKYRHTPLQVPNYIRVIILDPAEDPTAKIQCCLEAVSLDNYPEWDADFTALSYSWDAQKLERQITCHDAELMVTPNCEAAMQALRDTSEPKRLWIDSICIDQSNNAVEERNAQVAMMGKIYKSARKVIVWVGEGDERVEAGLKLINDIAEPLIFIGSDGIDRELWDDIVQQSRQRVRDLSNSVTRPSDDPFGPLFARSWFYRMWTVQEVTLAWLDRIYVRCGKTEILWTALFAATDMMNSEKYKWYGWKTAMSLQRQLNYYLIPIRYIGGREIMENKPGARVDPLLFHILVNAREKKASNPKDKVFALYGLFQEMDVTIPAPDYSKAVEDVYWEATKATIMYDNNLYILYHAPSDRRLQQLASWVPDFSEQGFSEGDPRYGILRSRFAASKSEQPKWSFSDDNRALTLTGKIVDTVLFRAEPLPNLDSMISALRESGPSGIEGEFLELNHKCYTVLKSWVEVSQWSDYPTTPGTKDSKEALQRTLMMDNPKNNADAAANGAFDQWYEVMNLDELGVMMRGLRVHGQDHGLPQNPALRNAFFDGMMQRLSPAKRTHFALHGPAYRFHSLSLAFSQKKTFFYTENQYFGTAADPLPTPIQDGDKIAVVAGLEMPLILRPIEGGYKLLTHAYVHGIMNGEAWPKSLDALEEIVLL